jgi:hypothetical protein
MSATEEGWDLVRAGGKHSRRQPVKRFVYAERFVRRLFLLGFLRSELVFSLGLEVAPLAVVVL